MDSVWARENELVVNKGSGKVTREGDRRQGKAGEAVGIKLVARREQEYRGGEQARRQVDRGDR